MRSFRSVLQIAILTELLGCSSPEVRSSPAPGGGPDLLAKTTSDAKGRAAASPSPAPAPPPATNCADEPQAEKAYYEAQRLFQRKRFWEAAPTYVISYNHCAHAQVLCAAGQAYWKTGNCDKAADLVGRCMQDQGLPEPARGVAAKLLASAQTCVASGQAIARKSTSRGDDDEMAEQEPAEASPWAALNWSQVGGAKRAP